MAKIRLTACWVFPYLLLCQLLGGVGAFVNVRIGTKASFRKAPAVDTSSRWKATSVNDLQGDKLNVQTTTPDVKNDSQNEIEPSSNLRPFHQNWWPVAAVTSLQKDRPNAIQVLGKSLVVFYDDASLSWHVLDDLCSHRFAPLSEGRVIPSSSNDEGDASGCRLQCAYHGWEFNSQGTCTRVPQTQQQEQQDGATNKARPVQSYPVREAIHMLWVWMDPATQDSIGSSLPLPIHDSLYQAADRMGPFSCFQRDLPYGMEILGENLLDLSHLPFAHHSVGGLNRELGGYLPLRMLSKQERLDEAAKEHVTTHTSNSTTTTASAVESTQQQPIIPIPTFQAEVVDAPLYDPTLMWSAKQQQSPDVYKDWTCTIGYFGPCHVRYRRDRGDQGRSYVELFFCPTTEGRSRVFLFNVMVPGKPPESKPLPRSPLKRVPLQLWNNLKPSTWKQRLLQRMIKKIFAGERGHIMSHSIFDGDGIFLHKQGNRMKQANKSYKDYSTPSSADILLNAYRRWLDQVAQQTRANGLDAMAQSVVGMDAYAADDDTARAVLLDRYNTHTKNCPLCLAALQKTRRKKARLQVVQTALQGATGASAMLFLVALLAMPSIGAFRLAPLLRPLGIATAGSIGGSLWSHKRLGKLEKKINSFIFEDYIHAEKN